MAVHNPKKLSLQNRFEAWVVGICPYCGSSVTAESFTPSGRKFTCLKCNAENKFTLPRLINETENKK